MDKDEEKIKKEAIDWIKSKEGKKFILNSFADETIFIPESKPITLFMAGSPGAGKTEISKKLITSFKQKPVRIDADEIRSLCPGYNGKNSSIFQECANKGVNILYDYCLDKKISVILDGTFAYANNIQNIERSISRGRSVSIWFIYQDPIQAWKITKARESIEGRVVPMDVFINSYFMSQNNVNEAKKQFGKSIQLNFILKNFEDSKSNLEKLEVNVERVDSYIPISYNEKTLQQAIESLIL